MSLRPLANLLVSGVLAFVTGSQAVAQIPQTAADQSAATDQVRSSHAPQDVPDTLVFNGVTDFMRVNTVIYWHSAAYCAAPPPGVAQPVTPTQSPASPTANGDNPETISRLSTIGATPPRMIFYKNDPRGSTVCNPYKMYSRVVADGDFLYWVDASGLVKLSKNANPGDAPQLLNGGFGDSRPYNIAIDSQYIYLSREGYVSCGPIACFTNNPVLFKVNKSTGAATSLFGGFLNFHYAFDLKVDPGERYLYYLETESGVANLKRMNLSNPALITTISTNVHSYFPDGRRFAGCIEITCFFTDFVFIGRGSTQAGQPHQIDRYENANGSVGTVYISADTQNIVSINDITSDGSSIYFFELRSDYCPSDPCFLTYTAWLFRSGRANANALANIYQTGSPGLSDITFFGLDTDGVKLYWKDGDRILRLSNNATALPRSNMRITGMEVTQGVQDTSNSVPLIRNKRTFVRVFVRSDDPSRDVPGVMARLRATWTNGAGDWIPPLELYAITVRRGPSRAQLNQAYLFELPWDWLKGDNLVLTAELNPGHNPEQTDYSNNMFSAGPFHLNDAPRLEVRLFEFYYSMGGTLFGPAYAEKFGNIDWIRRAYPVDESNGNMQTPGGGLRWSWTSIRDDDLANQVRYPSVPCENKDTTPADKQDTSLPDCQNLRASAYVANKIAGMRDDLRNYGDTDNTTYYGLIAGGSEQRGNPPMTVSYFPRGQDGGKNGAGPAGNGYLGWYAGHEVGHSVGLGHPATAAAANECGIKGGDSLPTYPHAHIGSNGDTTNVEGFLDTPTYNYPRYNNANLAIGSQTFDVMAYCLPQWLSDQNYKRVYQNLAGHPPSLAPASTMQSGDWLVVYGSIFTRTNTATMDYLRHKIGNVTVTPRAPGAYAIRLRNGSGAVLVDYPFTPMASEDAPILTIHQVVTFAAGTRSVRIVRLAGNATLAEAAISANPPTVSNVTLPGAPNPVTGTITLTWLASDPDGGALKYDVLYSRDNGASFQPLVIDRITPTLQINTQALGGGMGKFRVVASDGANTGFAGSATFSMANKPPVPRITLPAGGIHAHYAQVVNFNGEAEDAQDGVIPDASLMWTWRNGVLAAGSLMSQGLLPPGANVITLTATNRANLSASTSITVFVDDDIDPAGPTLQVTPGEVTWHIASGVTAPQTQTLSVANVGTGYMAWEVTSNAAWLTVSAASGGDGDTLVATGNPAGMHNGEIRIGTLTFTNTSYGVTQMVQVPFTLIMGDVYQNVYTGPMPPQKRVYVPVVRH